jgi:hypothetical protein
MEQAKFGIIELKSQVASETTENLEFIFTVDMSASMLEFCSLNKRKIDYIIHTIKNMITYMHEKTSVDFHIIVNGFNKEIHEIVKRTKITPENYSSVLATIESIVPEGYTNIEKALIKCAQEVETIKADFPGHRIHHIFMTDGHATAGLKDVESLRGLVVKDIMNAFIGIGKHHAADILQGLCAGEEFSKCEYHFIDKLESAGLVYGEILYSIVYKLLTDVEIRISNGLVYDYKNNIWVHHLKIPDIIGEGCKTYNIISSCMDECNVGIIGNQDSLCVLYPSQRTAECDLTQHVFRQRVLQLLYQVKNFYSNKSNYFGKMIRPDAPELFYLQGKIGELMSDMLPYVGDGDFNGDKFMKNLYNDVLVCFHSFGKQYGDVFCSARQTSQGTQRIYTVSNISSNKNTLEESFWTPLRETNPYMHQDTSTDTHQISREDSRTILDMHDSPYSTRQATQVMNFISTNL